MKNVKKVLVTLVAISCFSSQMNDILANQNEITSSQQETFQDKENTLSTVYLNGSSTTSGSGKTEQDPVNTLEKALALAKNNATIFITGEVIVKDDIIFPNKTIIMNNQKNGKIKFEKSLALQNMLYVNNTTLEFTSHDKDCIFLNGNYSEFRNCPIIGKPNFYMGKKDQDITDEKTTASINIYNNTNEKTVLGNIYMGGKNNHQTTVANIYLENTVVEGIIDGTNVSARSRLTIAKSSSIKEAKNISIAHVYQGATLDIQSQFKNITEFTINGELNVKNGSQIDVDYIYGTFYFNISIPTNEKLIQGNYLKCNKLVGEMTLSDSLIEKGFELFTFHGPKTIDFDIYDKNNKIETNYVPVIQNLNSLIIKKGQKVDLKANITAWDVEDGDLTNRIVFPTTPTETLDVGMHKIPYEVTDNKKNKTIMYRMIQVLENNAPMIIGANDTTIKIGEVDHFDLRKGIQVNDDKDQNLTLTIEGKIGKPKPGEIKNYPIIYSVTDSDKNTTKVTRTITVTNQIPQISGLHKVIVKEGDPIDLLKGISVTDLEDGNLIKNLEIIGDIDTTHIGSRTLTYKVTDSDGNTIELPRELTVEKKKISKIEIKFDGNYSYNGASIPNPTVSTIGSTGKVSFKWEKQEGDKWIVISSSPVNAGHYRVTASVSYDETYGSAISTPVEFTIQKANPIYQLPTHLISSVGKTLADVSLPHGFTWQDDLSTKVGDYGNHVFKVTYTPNDTQNYHIVKDIEVTLKVNLTINYHPIIQANDKTIYVGDTFDPFNDVSALDKEDGKIALNNQNIVENNVDTTKAGTYHVTYQATDKEGASTTKRITVLVKEKNIQQDPNTEIKPNKPNKPNKTNKPNTINNDKKQVTTGVNSHTTLFALLLVGSAALLSFLSSKRRKNL